MSDTQGAQDETGSGGLANDMPGIGNAPPSPRMVPSGLGGIANFARQTGIIGGPAPQPAQPGVSPFAAPGRSQLPPPPAGPQPGRRWEGTTASLALPRGAVQPPAKFTPFIGSLPTSNWRQWGQPEEYPNLPQSFELPGIAQGLAGFFGKQGQGGGGLIQALALTQGKYAGEFLKAFQQGEEFKAKMAREKWLQHSLELQDQLEQRHTLYADHIRMYMEKADYDQSKLGNINISGISLRDQLHRDAMQTGDEDIIRMIEDGSSFQKIMDYQNYRDSKLKDLQKVNTKAQQQTDEDKIWGGSGQTPAPDPTNPFAAPTPQPQPDAGGTQPQPQPSGGAAPSMVASNDPNSPFANPNAPSPDAQPASAQDSGGGLSAEDAATLQAARGYELDPKMAPGHRQIALRDSEALKGQLQNIISNPNLSGEQVRQAVRAIPKYGPSVDAELNGIASYKQPVGGTSGSATGGRQGEWSGPDGILTRLVQKYDPQWNQAYYHDRDRFRTDATTQMTLLRTSGISADANAVLEDLKVLEKSGRATTGLDLSQVIDNAKRDPMYVGLAADWQAYNDAFNTIVSGGRHTVSGTREQVNVAPTSYASPAAFRAAMKGHMNDAYGIIDGLHRRWQSIGGKPDDMPSYDANLEKNIRDIRDMDWLTGTFPGDPYTSSTGKTKIWQPKEGNSRNPYDTSNWR